MKKIGIVTLHNHNYGSALQCFASQEYLKKCGFDVEVLNQVQEYSLFKRYLTRLWELFTLCLFHPLSIKKILSVFNSQRKGSLRITPESEKEISRFNSAFINNTYYSAHGLCDLGEKEDFSAFLSGSDQVWNGSRTDLYDFYFLRFAPSEKRVAWAASFGGNKIAPYNKKRYSQYLVEYNKISVRESSAIGLVQELANIEAVCLADPVTLLYGGQWRELYQKNAKEQSLQAKYILLFFLDKPSGQARSTADYLSQKTGAPIVTYGYRQNGIETHVDGGPWEFLSMIDCAEYVLTDSFHAMVFSLLFHKEFYVFDRQYVHKQSQVSRIVDLLKSVDLLDRFEPTVTLDKRPVFTKADEFFEQSREAFDSYVTFALKKTTLSFETGKKKETVKDYASQCCGCGACAEICPEHAISMTYDENGHIYPKIDIDFCSGCNACRKICAFRVSSLEDQQKIGFVACGRDANLIKSSASGGVFATIAKTVIGRGGLVYGASLWLDKGNVKCEHIAVDTIEELYKIQGSKYVQSVTQGIFSEIKEQLKTGRIILFSGTSCQVAALKGFLRRDYDNLLTIDLICHGVPSLTMLQNYLNYQRCVYKEEIIDFKFRVRDVKNKPYQTTTITRDSHGTIKPYKVGLRDSAFYRLFMGRGGYRPSCYSCPFACVNKPADITIGDYYPNNREGFSTFFPKEELLSTVVSHTEKGQLALQKQDDLLLYQEKVSVLKKSHEQLNSPSLPSSDGIALYTIYKEKGFRGVQNAVSKRNIELLLPHVIKCVTKRKN